MPTSRRNPFDGVTDFVSELGRIRTLGVHGSDPGGEHAERTHASAWVPTTDILARGDDLVIRLELPGIHPDDVDLLLHHGLLSVSGTRARVPGDDDTDFYVRERYRGAFRRVITLPDGTDASRLSAEFEHGLLEIIVHGAAAAPGSVRITATDRSRGATTRGVGSGGSGGVTAG